MSAARAFSFPAFLLLFNLLALVDTQARAQTSINDVHITARAGASAIEMVPSPSGHLGLIRTNVDLVMVPVSITDGLNRPVVGLDRENFQIFENKIPQQIRDFSTEDAPVSIGIVLDVSGSMGPKLERAREAVTAFCEEANPQDEFFMITFSDEPQLIADFTTKTEELENDLLTARSKGRTSLLDAVYMALHKMRGARYARKALLIISDGGDNHSRYTERDVRSAVKEADVTIYSVGTFDSVVPTEEELLGPELLRSITEPTGGMTFTLNASAELPDVTKNIGVRLRHQYLLAYRPQSAKDGKWHKIMVKLRVPRKFPFLRVNARPGYYARGGE
jgi:Ca-activated chloride channel homolog